MRFNKIIVTISIILFTITSQAQENFLPAGVDEISIKVSTTLNTIDLLSQANITALLNAENEFTVIFETNSKIAEKLFLDYLSQNSLDLFLNDIKIDMNKFYTNQTNIDISGAGFLHTLSVYFPIEVKNITAMGSNLLTLKNTEEVLILNF